ncbi:MAG: hypothetical protein Q7W05_00235 [Deltaproteobacteria bacterium]|nr:hypothetical protein [Deltaproteobacteria bacterium]
MVFLKKRTIVAVGSSVLLMLGLIVCLPFLHKPFGTYSLPARDLLIITVLAFSVSPVLELAKFMVRKGWLGKDQ